MTSNLVIHTSWHLEWRFDKYTACSLASRCSRSRSSRVSAEVLVLSFHRLALPVFSVCLGEDGVPSGEPSRSVNSKKYVRRSSHCTAWLCTHKGGVGVCTDMCRYRVPRHSTRTQHGYERKASVVCGRQDFAHLC